MQELAFLSSVEWAANHHTSSDNVGFLETGRGHVGLGPCFAQPGDVVAILRGWTPPFCCGKQMTSGATWVYALCKA